MFLRSSKQATMFPCLPYPSPWDHTVLPKPLLRHLLQSDHPFRLDLVQGLARGKAHVVHALRVAHAKPGSLAAREQKHGYFVLRDPLHSWGEEGGGVRRGQSS